MFYQSRVRADIIVVHPGKHHALHLVAGCAKAGFDVAYVTPFYRRGLGRLLVLLGGSMGSKAAGYFHPALDACHVHAPLWWQVRKLWALYQGSEDYVAAFDKYVARGIRSRKYSARLIVALQDYMPETVRAAGECGMMIWSDQISNRSPQVHERVASHAASVGQVVRWKDQGDVNDQIIQIADLVVLPSMYCLSGIEGKLNQAGRLAVVPYGVDAAFTAAPDRASEEIMILARANTLWKGGHLLLKALASCSGHLLALSTDSRITVRVLGRLAPELLDILHELHLPDGMSVTHGDVPHAMMPALYRAAWLFFMPSLSEGMSLACVEAMQAGLPLIITPYCGIDGFEDGRMGYVVADSVESLANALVRAFESQSDWVAMGEASRALAAELTWGRYERQVGELAKGMLA